MKKAYRNQPQTIDLGFTHAKIRCGLHLFDLYRQIRECNRYIGNFINVGLQQDKAIAYCVDLETKQLLDDYLHKIGINQELMKQKKEQINCQLTQETYHPSSIFYRGFHLDNMFAQFEFLQFNFEQFKNLVQKCREIKTCLRVTSQMNGSFSPNVGGREYRLSLLLDESQLRAHLKSSLKQQLLLLIKQIIKQKNRIFIWQDDANKFDPELLFDRVVRNPYYLPAQPYLA